MGLALASQGLARGSNGLAEASQGLAWDSQGLAEASQGLAEASQGLAEASQGLAEASQGLDWASLGLAQAWGGTDGRTYGRTEILPCVLQDFVPFGSAAQKADEWKNAFLLFFHCIKMVKRVRTVTIELVERFIIKKDRLNAFL